MRRGPSRRRFCWRHIAPNPVPVARYAAISNGQDQLAVADLLIREVTESFEVVPGSARGDIAYPRSTPALEAKLGATLEPPVLAALKADGRARIVVVTAHAWPPLQAPRVRAMTFWPSQLEVGDDSV
jgi:hypothetical protein